MRYQLKTYKHLILFFNFADLISSHIDLIKQEAAPGTSSLESAASVGPSPGPEPVTRTKTRKSRFRTHSNSGLRLQLPEFSSPVKQHLDAGEAQKVWTEMLRELTNFYAKVDQCHPEGFHAFHEVGQLMFKAYPSIARAGPHPWVRTSKCLCNHFWGKVMFSQVFVCPRGGGSLSDVTSFLAVRPPGQRPLRTETPPGTVKNGRYVSYWNAFLFYIVRQVNKKLCMKTCFCHW